MTRIDGPGKTPSRPPANAEKSQNAKPAGKSFDEILGGPEDAEDGADSSKKDEKKDKKGLPAYPGGVLRFGGSEGQQARSTSAEGSAAEGAKPSGGGEANADQYDRSYDRKAEEARASDRRAADRRDAVKDSDAGAGNVAQGAAKGANPIQGAQKAADVQVSRELMQKLVDQVRVGQNKAGDTEVQMDLKATVFEGMSMKVSKGPEGVLAILTVDQLSAKAALESQVADLVSRLEAQGMQVQDVQVELRETAQQPGSGSPEGGDAQAGGEGGEFGYDPNDSSPFGSPGTEPSDKGRPGASTPEPNKPRRKESSTDYTL